MRPPNSKIRLLKLWEILSGDSDEDNPIGTTELLAKLGELGFECDRRTLYSDVRSLNESGHEVMSVLRNHSNHYYVLDRSFNIAEVKILMDAVTAFGSITAKKTAELQAKVAALAGTCRAEVLKRSQQHTNAIKTQNESIYYNIDSIDRAITEATKLSFVYLDYGMDGHQRPRHQGARYVVNPLATVQSGDRYYLIAYDDDSTQPRHFRIDKMSRTALEQQPIVHLPWLDDLDLEEFKRQLFSMFVGRECRVTMVADHGLVDIVYDKFGIDTQLNDLGDGQFCFGVTVRLSPVFYGWCLNFGDRLRVTSPPDVVDELRQRVSVLAKMY